MCFLGNAGKEFVPPYEDPQLKLGGLLALNLHEFSSDVEEIADQVRFHSCCKEPRFRRLYERTMVFRRGAHERMARLFMTLRGPHRNVLDAFRSLFSHVSLLVQRQGNQET